MQTPGRIAAAALIAAALAAAWLLSANSLWLGQQSLLLRAILLSAPLLAASTAIWLLPRKRSPRAATALFALGLLSLPVSLAYHLYWLPRHGAAGLSIRMTEQRLITDSSSNALVEIGFAYPIFTPTVELGNGELFSRQLDVYLRMIDAEGESTLYRAVREAAPDETLSVESSVRGMLSANERYLFLPLQLAPGEQVTGRLVFIITALDESASFLGEMRRAQFELRDATTQDLLLRRRLQDPHIPLISD